MNSADEMFLHHFYSEFSKLFPNGTNFTDIISAVIDDKLSIERSGPNITIMINNESIKEIEKTVPYLHKICEKPHSFIKTYEDKTFVSTAKRINSKAISHLSRDSNDWFARTFLTVIPKNILSDISEETLDLYENRFLITLIDEIINTVTKERIKYEEIDERYKNEKIQNRLQERGYIKMNSNSNELSKKLLKNKQNFLNTDTAHETITDYLKRIVSLEKKIKHMKQSKLYSELRKCHRVQNPIRKTNILNFDPRYNTAYRLWEYLYHIKQVKQEEIITLDDSLRPSLPVWYVLFTLVTTSCALKDMGFVINQDSTLEFHENQLFVKREMIWERNDDIMRLSFFDNKITLRYCIDDSKDKWDKIVITPDFSINFENKSLTEVRGLSNKIIDELALRHNKKKEEISHFYFLSTNIRECSNNNDWGETIYRRFFNIGDNYSNEENNIANLSFYQSGTLIISPENFQVNFLRIQRLLNSRIMRNKVTTLDICPICGDKNIRRPNNKEIICDSCRHYISMSVCRNDKCNTEFLWIRYIDNKFLDDKEININFETTQYYETIMRSENIMGEFAITSFSIEKDKSNIWKLYSLCPKCGRKLGN